MQRSREDIEEAAHELTRGGTIQHEELRLEVLLDIRDLLQTLAADIGEIRKDNKADNPSSAKALFKRLLEDLD